jgi:DNA-binding Lrp family transcriptional regulator
VSPARPADPLDLQVLSCLVTDPRMSVSQVAERVGIARNTAQARLDRLHDRGVLGRNDRGLDLSELGLTVTANVAVEVEHAQIHAAVQALSGIPFVLLVEEVAGPSGDLLVRVATRSNQHLQEVVHAVLSCPGVRRTITSVVLATHVLYRVQPLLEHLAAESTGEGRPDGVEPS